MQMDMIALLEDIQASKYLKIAIVTPLLKFLERTHKIK